MLARLSCCVALLLLAGCAAAVPGYTPPPFKEKGKHAQAMQSGEVTDGRYEMAEQEKLMDCKRTAGSMSIIISRLRHRSSEVGSSDLAIAANKAGSPYMRHSTKGLDRDVEYTRDRARLEAYNRHLASKGCQTVDIEAELARPPDPPGKKY
ncbi:MAG: hypothetical protein K2X43_04830 [Hyphomonadaceae bacterium]|jgi:hypothetical protein|nr:hypothetical protein [Hyphomonadaceae bacterium]